MTDALSINTPNWQTSHTSFGDVLTDADDIIRCLEAIVLTRPGEVPLNPYFGSGVLAALDKPINKIVPAIVAACQLAIALWEPRVFVSSVTVDIVDNANVQLTINAKIIATSQTVTPTFPLKRA